MPAELSDAQLGAFDTEYVNDRRWALVDPLIDESFGSMERFTVLDVGGGNGQFADRILRAYPAAQVIVVEPSATLLDRNVPDDRKLCIRGGADLLTTLEVRPDLVCFNWVLHHLIEPTYRHTRLQIRSTLRQAASILSDDGRISVFENNYNGTPVADVPGFLTYHALRAPGLARLARHAGANTAEIGVCFLSRTGWHRMFRSAELELESDSESNAVLPSFLERHPLARKAVMLREVRIGHYWLRA